MRMDVPGLVWLFTMLDVVGLLGFDSVFHVRRAHIPSAR
jgi:tellurite resistance protein TerC